MWTYVDNDKADELCHYGRKGMKWYQNIYTSGKNRVQSYRKTKAKIKEIDRKTSERIKKIKVDERNKAKINKAKAKSKAEIEAAKKKYQEKYAEKEQPKDTKNAKTNTKVEAKPVTPQPAKKTVKDMSDAELQAAVNRLRLENDYRNYTPKQKSVGKEYVMYMVDKAVLPAVADASKAKLTKELKKAFEVDKK